MNEEIMNEIQPVRPKDQFTFSLPSMRGVLPQYRRLCNGGESGRLPPGSLSPNKR